MHQTGFIGVANADKLYLGTLAANVPRSDPSQFTTVDRHISEGNRDWLVGRVISQDFPMLPSLKFEAPYSHRNSKPSAVIIAQP